MDNIKCIFFDIGYTLINEDDVWQQRCLEQSQMEEAKSLSLSPEQIYDAIIQASLQYKPQYRTVINKFGFTNTAPYRHNLEKLYDNADLILQTLANKYKLGIIANQTDGLTDRLHELGIFKNFSFIISSWDYQIMKPDIKLFEIAVKKSGYNASEIVMVGDRLDNDILPAKQIGMRTIWIKQGFGGMQNPKSDEYIPDIEISQLNDLLEVL
ncbi:MAG: HAD family hydrolase [Clostridium sp.]|uniref:HAD family hydrolase n=1 Tax=Clostridium sp. TaxID=1506 RepID=UPI00301FDCDF